MKFILFIKRTLNMKKSYFIYSESELKRKDNTLQIKTVDGVKKDIPIETISDIYVMTEMTFNTSLINLLSQYGIIIHFFNYYNFYNGSYYPREKNVSGRLLVNQVEHYTDENKRLILAKEFVLGATDGILRNMRYYNERGRDLKEQTSQINELKRLIEKQKNVQELMGIEGNIHKIYYKTWNDIINQEIDFEKRVKRPPDNMINTLISYVNSMIYTTVLSQIYITQLNPTISYLHVPSTKRFSLALDIAEIFKPLIGDRMIFSLFNKLQISEKHFIKELNGLQLTKQGSMIISKEFDDRLSRTVKHKNLGKDVSYKYLIRLEAYKLIKHLIGEKEYQSFRLWW